MNNLAKLCFASQLDTYSDGSNTTAPNSGKVGEGLSFQIQDLYIVTSCKHYMLLVQHV